MAGSARWTSSSDQQREAARGQALEGPEDRLDDPPAHLVRRDEGRGAPIDAERVEPLGEPGHEEAEVVAGRPDDVRQAIVGERCERARQGGAERLVGDADGRRVGSAAR